ncbi:MAG: TonB-dependent receptor [Verrucomicrobia bacterium]|nr:TonB-dependent receptor [Verrucomicrobiota bacterium]
MPPPARGEPLKLEPVLVTADLWEAPLARMSASVTVYDDAALRSGAVKHFADLADEIPNLTFTGATSRPRYLQIRGIGENSQYEGETPDSTVRFLVDDLDFTGLGTIGDAFDVKQVEVLRGPQAGAFGANAAGGVVRLVTNAPTPFWTGLVETGLGNDHLRTAGFAVGGPLLGKPEELMARVALHWSGSDGFRRNVMLQRDTNARDEFAGRLRLTWNPTADWRWDGTAFYANAANGFDEFALNNNGRFTYSDQPGRDAQRSRALSLRGTFKGLPAVRLTTITGAAWTHSVYSYDDDWTPASYAGFSYLKRDREVFNQELRLDSAASRAAAGWIDRWTIGGYFSRTYEKAGYTDTDPGNIRGLATNYHADNTALYGQLAHDLDQHTRLIVGLRVEDIDLDGDGTKTRYRKSRGTFDPVVTFRPSFSDTLVGGKVTLEHDVSEHELAFVSITRGYKAGGINVDARISPPADPLTYATENLWNYEAGFRGHWLEQRLTGEFTAFYLSRRDTQVRDSAGFGGNYRFFTANGRGAHVAGVEASAAFAISKEISLFGSLSTMSSQLDRFTLTNGNTGGGRRLANTPPHGYTIGVRGRSASGVFGQLALVGRGEQFDSNNQNESRRAFKIVNASLGYAWQRWTLTAWARNLTNTRYEKRVFFFGNEDPDYIETRYEDRADPRQFGVSAAYRW